MIGVGCDHECAVHHKVEPARIVGAVPKKITKEARQAYAGIRKQIEEFHEAARRRR